MGGRPGTGELGHDMRLDELIVGGAAGHDEAGGDSGTVLADAFEDARALGGGRGAIAVGGISEDDDDVEVGGGCVAGGEGDVLR